MNKPARDWVFIFSQALLIVTAVAFVVILPVLSIFGALENIEWLRGSVPIITLLGIGLLITAIVIDRHTQLSQIEKKLQRAIDTNVLGVQYLEGSESVVNELINMARSADDVFMAIGGKSTAKSYLDQLEKRIIAGEIMYYRLLTGDHITHDLHAHLEALIDMPGVFIAWNYSEKYGAFTVSEHQVIFTLPTPHPTKFSGIKLPGESVSRIYSHYFLEAFSKSVPIKTKNGIKALCETCSPDITRGEQNIEKILRDEIASSVSTNTPV